MTIKFSIILPTYNREKFVVKAIESVIKQDYTLWELIVIDDGSTDRTFERVNAFIEKDKRIKYYYQKNQERSVARNHGISKSKGEWICFLDSDDTYYHNHLFEFSNLIKQSKFKKGLYFCGVSFEKFDKTRQKYSKATNNLEFVLLNSLGAPRACCSKEILIENKFNPNINTGEDMELWVRVVKNFPVYFHHNKTFIEINHDNRSINQDIGFKHLETLKYIIKNNDIKRKIKYKLLSDSFFKIATNYIKKSKNLQALYFLSKSIVFSWYSNQNVHKFLLILAILRLYKRDVLRQYLINS